MAERVEITVLVDNSVDIFLPSSDIALYPVPGKTSQLWAEQGLSLWIEVSEGKKRKKILYDFGRSGQVLLHNTKILNLNLKELDFLVLSHGHIDHYGGLAKMLRMTGEKCKLILHPEAPRRKRYIRLSDGSYVGPWKVRQDLLKEFNSRIITNAHSSDLGLGIHISGEIERKNDFEKGMPNAFMEVEKELVHDGIEDDQSLFIELEVKGVIVLTGCCHAGVVNTLSSAQKMFPGQRIYALMGGFHLNQAEEKQMKKTLEFLLNLNLRYMSAMHCTGYYAQKVLMEEFRDRWIPNTVGAKIMFTSRG
jgi:7,8-dihydropterin-6-yl-methyl-4-(beta-D-ribofuranosyl)aminobenzene 5'-phosphate synthase